MTNQRRRWSGTPPQKCDTCDAPITNEFSDMKTIYGPWGCLCPTCSLLGPGIGRYVREPDGVFYKVEG
jgi:hypothetical protein